MISQIPIHSFREMGIDEAMAKLEDAYERSNQIEVNGYNVYMWTVK